MSVYCLYKLYGFSVQEKQCFMTQQKNVQKNADHKNLEIQKRNDVVFKKKFLRYNLKLINTFMIYSPFKISDTMTCGLLNLSLTRKPSPLSLLF